MAGITLAQAEAKLTLWLAAEDKVASGQSYEIAGRKLARADLGMIGDRIAHWDSMVKRLSRGGIRIRQATPTD